MVRDVKDLPSGSSIVRPVALVRTCLGRSNISYYSFLILVSASSSCFTLLVAMREVYCVGYPFPIVLAKWSLVFQSFGTSSQRLKTA